jgi:hypothetical protein
MSATNGEVPLVLIESKKNWRMKYQGNHRKELEPEQFSSRFIHLGISIESSQKH